MNEVAKPGSGAHSVPIHSIASDLIQVMESIVRPSARFIISLAKSCPMLQTITISIKET
jgi:hypothetical protein